MMLNVIHADFDSLARLIAHIDLACRVVADQHHGKTGRHVMLAFQARYMGGHALAYGCSESLAVDNGSRHGHVSVG